MKIYGFDINTKILIILFFSIIKLFIKPFGVLFKLIMRFDIGAFALFAALIIIMSPAYICF